MTAFLSMSLSVLIWSLYPLAATIGLQSMGSLEMIFIVYYFSGFGAIIVTALYLWKKKLFKRSIAIQKELGWNAYIPVIVSGVAGILCHAFFIISLTMANKAGVSLIYESWPIIAVIATPFLMRKSWKEVSLKEFMVSLLALGGVAIIILSDASISFKESMDISQNFDYTALGGYVLAFAGAYMCAVLVVTKGTYSENFNSLEDTMAASFISEVFSRVISMFLISIAFIYLSDDLIISHVNWTATFFVGFIVFVVAGALYTYSLLKTDRPTMHVMYYFVPILAVFWLWIVGEASINSGLFIGGAIVLFANIYLVIEGRKAALAEKPTVGL